MSKKYNSFTLIEMLIVMGILIILLAVGVSVGRYAILKAQDTKHRDAARSLYQILLEYKNDNGTFPELGSCSTCISREFFAYSLGYSGSSEQNVLKKYLEKEIFDGGTPATYYYSVDMYQALSAVVCVSLGGIDDESERGFFCIGDVGSLPESNPILYQDIGSQASGDLTSITIKGLDQSDWDPDQGGFWLSN